MSEIINALISAKEYFDKGVSCTLRFHNFTEALVVTEQIGPSKHFDAAIAPPLFIKSDSYGDAVFSASKIFGSTLNVFYSVTVDGKQYGIQVNYIWKKQTDGEIQVKVVEGDSLYPKKEIWIPLFQSGAVTSDDLPFNLRYMASGSLVEVGLTEK